MFATFFVTVRFLHSSYSRIVCYSFTILFHIFFNLEWLSLRKLYINSTSRHSILSHSLHQRVWYCDWRVKAFTYRWLYTRKYMLLSMTGSLSGSLSVLPIRLIVFLITHGSSKFLVRVRTRKNCAKWIFAGEIPIELRYFASLVFISSQLNTPFNYLIYGAAEKLLGLPLASRSNPFFHSYMAIISSRLHSRYSRA